MNPDRLEVNPDIDSIFRCKLACAQKMSQNQSKTESKQSLRSGSKTDPEVKNMSQTSQVESSELSIPPNRLPELDLNDCAVEIKNLKFTYDKSKGYLLNNINLTFPRSAIYGFLGPSGCGKTTIIKLIVGLLRPSSGTILVNGRQPTDPVNKIPGPGIGYMPQVFTINETFKYFAKIYGLSDDFIDKRINFLIKLLDLPDRDRSVAVLSGGQKRRTSLAVAIIHNPPILIMDEPTVGVDPILREKIWGHLLRLSTEEKTSIMITTHYIDECRRAHAIGLMRNGKILAESSPNILLIHFKTDNLEDVFLQVCRAEEGQLVGVEMPPTLAAMRGNKVNKPSEISKALNHFKSTTFKRIITLIKKNMISISRNKVFVIIQIFIPVLTIILFNICIGNKPFDLDVALNSEERRNTSVGENSKLSEILLKNIDKKTIILKDYSSQKSAMDSVRNGKTYGVIHIHGNFSSAFIERTSYPLPLSSKITDEVIRQSTVNFTGDLSDLNVFQTIFRTLIEAMFGFGKELISNKAKQMNTTGNKPNPKAMALYIQIEDPIYGTRDPIFKDFLLSGIVVTGVFLLASALTSLTLIDERRSGLLERSLVAGTKLYEILLALIFVQMLILIVQVTLTIITAFIVFSFTNKGNYLLIIVIIVMQGICGIGLGLAVSSMASTPKMAILTVVATIIPFLLISGIIWPLEGYGYFLRYISYLLPQTMSIQVLRAITLKGWTLNRLFIWLGYISPIIWTIIFIIITLIASHFRKD